MEASSGKISFKNMAPFIQSNRSLAASIQQLRIDLAIRNKRIRELEMENDRLRERIAEMENANDEKKIEIIAKRRVEKKVKLIRTAALKSIGSLQRFVKVIDESVDEVDAPLSSSGLFEKIHSSVSRASQLGVVTESSPYSPPKVLSDISNCPVWLNSLITRDCDVRQKRAYEQEANGSVESKKPEEMNLLVELQEREITEHDDKDDECSPNALIQPLHHPYVADRSKRKSSAIGERWDFVQHNNVSLLDEISPSTLNGTPAHEKRKNSDIGNESRSEVSFERSGTGSADSSFTGRLSRTAATKVKSYKEPDSRIKVRRTS